MLEGNYVPPTVTECLNDWNNAVHEFVRYQTIRNRVSDLTDNHHIQSLDLSDISDDNLEPCVRTLENLYSKYPKNGFLNRVITNFLIKCFSDVFPPLKDDITLDEIYNYFEYVVNMESSIIDWNYTYQQAKELFKKPVD